MPVRTPQVNKLPGEDGFVDEFNAAAAELAKVAGKILKVEVRRITADGSTAYQHGLGATPEFVWGFYDALGASLLRSGITVSEAEKRTWTPRTVRFTADGNTHYVFFFTTK